MARNKLLSALVLYPISKIYGVVIAVRNKLFDLGVLKQFAFPIPVVSVGNIAMGGTGKTPHTEYILDILRSDYRLGMLSRGYRRLTKGFVAAGPRSRIEDIGDEPYQIYQKFGNEVQVAVCEKRVDGIEHMLEADPELGCVVLDDAFQHRYVKPAVNVVLMEFNRPPFYDSLLPYGRLREPIAALKRSDIVIVTKCPEEMKPMEMRIFKEKLSLFAYQKLFFSRYAYGHLVPVFPEASQRVPFLESFSERDSILALTSVANPRPFVRHLRRYNAKVKRLRFPDHHTFTHADMETLLRTFQSLAGDHKIIVTTEKDAVRLQGNPYFPRVLKPCIFYIPIKVEFVPDKLEPASFDKTLRDKLRKFNTNEISV